jgi:hypothetical protein
MTRNLVVTTVLLGIAAITTASHRNVAASPVPAASCSVQGVWDMDSLLVNGKAQSMSGSHQRVINTSKYFMWLSEAIKRDTLPLKTFRDTVAYYDDAGGSGTYTVSGTKLVQHIDYFPDPKYIGKDWNAVCRTTGKRWYHTWIGDPYTDTSTHQVRRDTVLEIYYRVE